MGEATAPKEAARPRLTAQERRASILAAARQEFSRVGYHGASTASIAREAGCSEPMLYKHFSGKQHLFTASLEEVGGTVEAEFHRLADQPGTVYDVIQALLPQLMSSPQYLEMLRLRKLAVAIADQPAVGDSLRRHNERHLDRTRTMLDRGKAEGIVRPEVEAEYVAWMWNGLMLAGCFRESIEPGGFMAMLPHVSTFLESLRIAPAAA